MHNGFTLFHTTLGNCGIAWRGAEITAIRLPGTSDGETRRRLAQMPDHPVESAPPQWVSRIIARLCNHLDGKLQDLSDLPLAMEDLTRFQREVCRAARKIPPGQVTSYGELAEAAGFPRAARAAGRAMADNRFSIVVPCHRVLGADGKLKGFSAPGGLETKRRLLELEGFKLPEGREVALFSGRGVLSFEPDEAT